MLGVRCDCLRSRPSQAECCICVVCRQTRPRLRSRHWRRCLALLPTSFSLAARARSCLPIPHCHKFSSLLSGQMNNQELDVSVDEFDEKILQFSQQWSLSSLKLFFFIFIGCLTCAAGFAIFSILFSPLLSKQNFVDNFCRLSQSASLSYHPASSVEALTSSWENYTSFVLFRTFPDC